MGTAKIATTIRAPRTPRYQELARELREQILRGVYADTSSFPTESVLCERHDVSRFTVREALRTLQSEGLIDRRRGSRTVIRNASSRGNAARRHPVSGQIEIYGPDTVCEFTAYGPVPLPRRLAVDIGATAGERWLHFHGPRMRVGTAEPIAIADAYVHPDFVHLDDSIHPNRGPIFRQIEELAGIRIARVTQDIQAVPASVTIAAELKVLRRAPCLRILRRYLDEEGRVIEFTVNHNSGDRFAYSMEIEQI